MHYRIALTVLALGMMHAVVSAILDWPAHLVSFHFAMAFWPWAIGARIEAKQLRREHAQRVVDELEEWMLKN